MIVNITSNTPTPPFPSPKNLIILMIVFCEYTSLVIRQKAVVKVSYEAVDGDEISVQVGDVVDVISEVTEDEGWWKVNSYSVL